VDDDVVVGFLWLEVRQIQGPQRLDRLAQRLVDVAAAGSGAKVLPDFPEGPEPARAIESLPLAMFAEAHRSKLMARERSVNR
jgi:hypothetical protein